MGFFSRKKEQPRQTQPALNTENETITQAKEKVDQYVEKIDTFLENPAVSEKISPQEASQLKEAIKDILHKGGSDDEVRKIIATTSPELASKLESFENFSKNEAKDVGEMSLKEPNIAMALDRGKTAEEIARPFVEEGMYNHDLGGIFLKQQAEKAHWPQDDEDRSEMTIDQIKARQEEIEHQKKEYLLDQWSKSFSSVIEQAGKIPDHQQAKDFVEKAVHDQFEKFRPTYEKQQKEAVQDQLEKAQNLAG